jgi:hypothetical protein
METCRCGMTPTRHSLSCCEIDDDEFIELVSALEQKTSFLQLDLQLSMVTVSRTMVSVSGPY